MKPDECPQSLDDQHQFEELEDGSIVCFECDFILQRGAQPHKEDRHHERKKIPA